MMTERGACGLACLVGLGAGVYGSYMLGTAIMCPRSPNSCDGAFPVGLVVVGAMVFLLGLLLVALRRYRARQLQEQRERERLWAQVAAHQPLIVATHLN
jgi:hypothetical protein